MEWMNRCTTAQSLELETRSHGGTGGVSAENRCYGFRPAFLDRETGTVYLSCFANGCPAPFHILDGLPDEVVLARGDRGRVAAVKASIESGFVFEDRFYTREEAAEKVAEVDHRTTWQPAWLGLGLAHVIAVFR
jgi:hypothetical protein